MRQGLEPVAWFVLRPCWARTWEDLPGSDDHHSW